MTSSKKDKASTDRKKSADDYNFYRVYSNEGTPVQVNQLFSSADPYLGCFTAKEIGPPHLALNVRRFLCKLEKLPTTTSTELYKDLYSVEPLGDRDRIDLSRSEGRKSKALIFKILDEPAAPGPTPVPAPVPPPPAPVPTPRAPNPLCGNTYYIMNVYRTELCMNFGDHYNMVPGGEFEYFVIAHYLNRGAHQQWTVEDAGNGEVYLRNGMGKGCSLTNSNGMAFGARRGNDKWDLQREGSYFRFGYPGTSKVLDFEVHYDKGQPFNALVLKEPNGTAQQLWSFSKA